MCFKIDTIQHAVDLFVRILHNIDEFFIDDHIKYSFRLKNLEEFINTKDPLYEEIAMLLELIMLGFSGMNEDSELIPKNSFTRVIRHCFVERAKTKETSLKSVVNDLYTKHSWYFNHTFVSVIDSVVVFMEYLENCKINGTCA